MDLRKLQYFIELVEHGSLGKASRRLGVSQPALTKALAQLEQELGVRLVDRRATGVTPTVYGNSLFTHAKAMAAEAAHARRDIQQLSGEQADHVRVMTLPSLSTGVLSRAIATLVGKKPLVSIRVVEKQNYELLPALRRGECDFVVGLAEHWEPEVGVRRRVVFSDRLEITVRRRHPLAGRATVTHEDLLTYPWVFPIVGTTHGALLKQLFAEAGLAAPTPRVESGSVHFSKTVIQQGDCVGILPAHAMAAELQRGDLYCLPLTSDVLRRDIAFYYRDARPLSAATQSVMREIERSCRVSLPVMLRIACVGAILAGAYGIIHDEITFSISPEYFSWLKFKQFHYADFGLPVRVFVAEIGFLATWWVGFFAGWFFARVMTPRIQPEAIPGLALRGFVVVFCSALVSATGAYIFVRTRNFQPENSVLAQYASSLHVTDVRAFAVVACIHNASYLGGLAGIVAATTGFWRKACHS